MAWLRVTGGANAKETFRLTEAPATAGRAPTNAIQLRDEDVSRRHAAFRWDGHTHRVADLRSENGVLVNNQKVAAETMLKHGDRIRIGSSELVYESGPNVDYPVDYARQFKDSSREMKGETKHVDVADVQALLREMASGGGPPTPAPPPVAAPPPAAAQADPRTAVRIRLLGNLRQQAPTMGLQPMVDACVDALVRGLAPERVAVMLKQGPQAVLRPVKTYQTPDLQGVPVPPMQRELVIGAIRGGRPFLVNSGDPLPDAPPNTRAGFSALCTPLAVEGGAAGVLYVDSPFALQHGFTTEDLRFVMALAALLAYVIGR